MRVGLPNLSRGVIMVLNLQKWGFGCPIQFEYVKLDPQVMKIINLDIKIARNYQLEMNVKWLNSFAI